MREIIISLYDELHNCDYIIGNLNTIELLGVNIDKLAPLDSGYYTLETAIAKLPEDCKYKGVIITYEISDNDWEIKQFVGDDIQDITSWKSISQEIKFQNPIDGKYGDIIPLNKEGVSFYSCNLGPDNIIYFCEYKEKGIWKKDIDTGNIIPTNKITGTFYNSGMSSNNEMYFCSYGEGIWKLDRLTGDILPTNVTKGQFYDSALSSKGIMYFSSHDLGIWKLDDSTGDIIQTNITKGAIYNCKLSSDGTLYFCAYGSGIWKLDPVTENIVITNKEDGIFFNSCLSAEGVMYFCSYDEGIFKLDNTGNIVSTNIKSGTFFNCGLDSTGEMYFLSYDNTGIWRLDNLTGNIVKTNKTTGDFFSTGLSSEGKIYFLGSEGVFTTNKETKEIIQTNITENNYNTSSLIGNNMYFCSDKGAYVLNDSVFGRVNDSWIDLTDRFSDKKTVSALVKDMNFIKNELIKLSSVQERTSDLIG